MATQQTHGGKRRRSRSCKKSMKKGGKHSHSHKHSRKTRRHHKKGGSANLLSSKPSS